MEKSIIFVDVIMLLIQYWTDLCPNEKFNGVNSSLVQMGETLLNQEPNESFL